MLTENRTFPDKLRYHHLLIAVLIILFALSLRFIVIYQRAASDVSFVPQVGTDHHLYLNNGQGILDGTFPNAPFLFHPGPSYVFAGIYTLLGSQNFVLLTFVIALIDSLTCGFLIASAWLLSKEAWGGYLAGGIYAVYPVAIFYATTPLIAPLAAFYVSGFILFTLWQKDELSLWRTVILGVFAGLIAIHRLNLAPMVALYGLWLLMQHFSWRQRILHGLVFGIVTATIIAPFTYLNYVNSDGDFILIATTGSAELYMANNRDSAGRHGRTIAHEHVDMAYAQAILRDLRVAPEHFWGLWAYKFALFWSDIEPGNNLNFDTARENAALLNLLPLRFTALMFGGLIGLSLLWYQDRRTTIYLALMIAWICFGYVLVFAFGRIRFPVVVPMTLLSAYTLISVGQILRTREIGWQHLLKRHLFAVMMLVLLIIFVNWALFPEPKLPPERTYSDLPQDAVRVDAHFGEVTLVGWRYLDEWNYVRDGWIPVFESYAVELFWQISDPTDTDYNFFIAYIDEGQRYDAIDTPLGAVSFPSTTTDEWQVGQIYGEVINLRLDDDVPQERSAQIRVGVWYWDDNGEIANVPLDNGEANLLIQHIAVFNNSQVPPPPDLPASDFRFGDLIVLRGYELPESAHVGETITVSFYWEALQNINEDYSLFLHVDDAAGETVKQGDNRPIPQLFSYNWMVAYPLSSELPLAMPDIDGTYQIYAGLYNSMGRLLVESPDNRILLGTIIVEE